MNARLTREINLINQRYNFIICKYHYNSNANILTFQLVMNGFNCAKLNYNLNEHMFDDPRKTCRYLSNYRIIKILELEADLAEIIDELW